METTLVIFRQWRANNGGGIIALFPEIPSDNQGRFCESFEHVGQHGGADYYGVMAATKPVKPADYKDLARELKGRGYNLKVIVRASRRMHDLRRASV